MGAISRRRTSGQAIVELAIATPVLIAMLLGAFNVAVLVSNKVVAGNAVRQGARLASEIGGLQTNPYPADTESVDKQILRNVFAVALAMNYSTLTDLYIYQATSPDGQLGDPIPGSAVYNHYLPDGSRGSGPNNFDISLRNQTPPNETSIGVKLVWTYIPPTGSASFTVKLSEYCVMKASPYIPS
jgi:Flp pilus assembly protein TadG